MLKRKNTKLFLWFFISMLLDVCVMHNFSVMGARPMLVFLLILFVALLESDFIKMLGVTIIASVVYAIMGVQSFGIELVFCVCASLGAYYLKKYPRHMSMPLRACIFTAIGVAVHSALLHFYNFTHIGPNTIVKTILPCVVYNTVLSALIFRPFRISVYKNEISKESIFEYAKR